MTETLQRIENDVKAAMRAKDQPRVGVLRLLVNRIKMTAKNDRNREVTDEDVIAGIQKSIKEANETRDIYVANGRDTTEQDFEIAVYSEYLPQQMDEDSLRQTIAGLVEQQISAGLAGKSLMGPVMAALKTNYGGQYDPRAASRITSELISATA